MKSDAFKIMSKFTVEKCHITQGDYFEFENRLRSIVTDLLMPVSDRLTEVQHGQTKIKVDVER